MKREAKENRVLGHLQATELTKEQLRMAKGGIETVLFQCPDYTTFGEGNYDCNESPYIEHD